MGYVVRAPIPFKLVVHHLWEMCGSGGHGVEGRSGVSGALLTKRERAELVELWEHVRADRLVGWC